MNRLVDKREDETVEIDDKETNWKNSRQAKYHERNNLKTFGYKLDKELGESFKEACKKAKTSQSNQLTKMMQEFIDKAGVSNDKS